MSDQLWMVRAEGGALIEPFLAADVVSVGWHEAGDLRGAADRSEVETKLTQAGLPGPTAKQGASVLWRFFHVMTAGDHVMTYDSNTRVYQLGTITGDVRFLEDPLTGGVDGIVHPYARDVTWERSLNRDDLSPATKRSLGSISTLFQLRDPARTEILGGAPAPEVAVTETPEDDTENQTYAALERQSVELIADLITNLTPRQLEELSAGLLRSMGYRKRLSKVGPDRGQDILASRDGMGFETPRILVEVKHRRRTAISAPDIRSFVGTLRDGDRGLYVSTGGFTKEARYEADRATQPVQLLTLEDLVAEIIDRYETMDIETRSLIPLRPVYWPLA